MAEHEADKDHTEHGPVWEDDERPSCRCGFNGTPLECHTWRVAEAARPDLLTIATENVVNLSAECARLQAKIESVERLRDSLRGANVGTDFVVGRLDAILAGQPCSLPGMTGGDQ